MYIYTCPPLSCPRWHAHEAGEAAGGEARAAGMGDETRILLKHLKTFKHFIYSDGVIQF